MNPASQIMIRALKRIGFDGELARHPERGEQIEPRRKRSAAISTYDTRLLKPPA